MKALQKLFDNYTVTTITATLYLLSTATFEAVAQERILTGTVYSEDCEPLPGANVFIKGTQRAVGTDLDGRYYIQVGISEKVTFSHVSYENLEEAVYDKDVIDATLQYADAYVCEFPGHKQRTIFGRIFNSIGNLFRSNE